MKTSENITNIATALAKAQAEINPAVFDASNPHFRSRYATLASVMQACRSALSKNQIAVVQGSTVSEKNVIVNTMLIHASGDFISDDLAIPIAQNTAQAIGSALTYGRRYGLSALVGIVSDEDDDDGESAMPKPNANEFAGEVKFAPQKGTSKEEPTAKTPNAQETKATKESKSKRASNRISLIREIFQTSTKVGMSLVDLKAFISKITGKSIAESGDLSDVDLPFVLGELQKLQTTERKAA